MLIEYIQQALRLAKYEILEDGSFYGEIPGFDGVWAQAQTLEDCREELRRVLEDWLILGLRLGTPCRKWQGCACCRPRLEMPPFAPIKRRELIQALKRAGFQGPFAGGRHEFLVKDHLRLVLPNPHKVKSAVICLPAFETSENQSR